MTTDFEALARRYDAWYATPVGAFLAVAAVKPEAATMTTARGGCDAGPTDLPGL